MMADDGPVQMDLGNVGTHDAKMTQSNSDTRNDMSYDVCDRLERYKAGKGTGTKGPNGSGVWHRGNGTEKWTSGRRHDGGEIEGEKGSKGSKPDWYGDRDLEKKALETRARARASAEPNIATIADSRDISE